MSKVFAHGVRFFKKPDGDLLFRDWRDLADKMAKADAGVEVSRNPTTIHSRLSAISVGRTGLSAEYRALLEAVATNELSGYEKKAQEEYQKRFRGLLDQVQSEQIVRTKEALGEELWLFSSGLGDPFTYAQDLIQGVVGSIASCDKSHRLVVIADSVNAAQAWISLGRQIKRRLSTTVAATVEALRDASEARIIRVLVMEGLCPCSVIVCDPFKPDEAKVLALGEGGFIAQGHLGRAWCAECQRILASEAMGREKGDTVASEVPFSWVESLVSERLE